MNTEILKVLKGNNLNAAPQAHNLIKLPKKLPRAFLPKTTLVKP